MKASEEFGHVCATRKIALAGPARIGAGGRRRDGTTADRLLFWRIEFSWFFYRQHLVTIGLHDAASYLARSSDPCNPTSHAWKAKLQQAKNLATTGSISGGAARVRGWTADSVTPHCTKIDNPIGTNGLSRYRGSSVYVVTVSTKFTYPSLGLLALLKLKSTNISASYSQRAVEPR
jgi:hypothetical protein